MNCQPQSKPIEIPVTLLAIAVGAVVLVSACATRREIPPPPAPQAQATAPDLAAALPTATGDVPYAYYYDVEVYYQPVIKIYWWFNGTVWVSGPRLPLTIVLREDARVMVNLHDTEPWKQHELVRKQHPHNGQ